MNCRLVSIALMFFVVTSGMAVLTARAAASWPTLPSVPVTIRLVNGTATYYVATLSNVPSGFDVSDGVYPDWCVDKRYNAVRDASFEVLLYSSLDSPPSLEPHWDMVNYILNHEQGGMIDVQDAIWYFIKMGSVGWWPGATPSATSVAIVNDALANGTGFVPGQGELLAVAALPLVSPNQITIIELRIPVVPVSVPVGGYSFSIVKASTEANNVAGFLPYLTLILVLTVLLVEFRRVSLAVGKKRKK